MIRPYHIIAKDADLCRRAGVEQAIFTEAVLGPFAHRQEKLRTVRKRLIDMALYREAIELGALGYRIDSEAAVRRARRMELIALRGKWLADDQDQELEDMLVGPAVDEILRRLK